MFGYIGYATPIAKIVDMRGDARVYRLSRPLVNDYYVLVSAVDTYSGPETLMFRCTPDGKVLSWNELRGSYRGGLDHSLGLKALGYKIKY